MGTLDSGAIDSGYEKTSLGMFEFLLFVEDSKVFSKRRSDMVKFRRVKSEVRKVNIFDDEGVGIFD